MKFTKALVTCSLLVGLALSVTGQGQRRTRAEALRRHHGENYVEPKDKSYGNKLSLIRQYKDLQQFERSLGEAPTEAQQADLASRRRAYETAKQRVADMHASPEEVAEREALAQNAAGTIAMVQGSYKDAKMDGPSAEVMTDFERVKNEMKESEWYKEQYEKAEASADDAHRDQADQAWKEQEAKDQQAKADKAKNVSAPDYRAHLKRHSEKADLKRPAAQEPEKPDYLAALKSKRVRVQ